MRSTFFGIELARRALQAFQTGTEVTGHNVSNSASPGYSRQRLEVVAAQPWPEPSLMRTLEAGQLGAGVEVAAVRRVHSQYLAAQIWGARAALAYYQTLGSRLSEVEAGFGEPTEQSGASLLANFFNGWHDLSLNPESEAARVTVLQHSRALAGWLRETAAFLARTESRLEQEVADAAGQINLAAARTAELIARIKGALAVGSQPNDLLDERDRLLEQLAELSGAQVAVNQDGSLVVTLGGRVLVQDVNWVPLRYLKSAEGGDLSLVWSDDGSAVVLTTGSLAATLKLHDAVVPELARRLDEVASSLIGATNEIHRQGFALDGASGREFFSGSGARDIEVALEQAAAVAAASTPNAGDGLNALRLAQLRSDRIAAQGMATLEDDYRGLIAALGSQTQDADQRTQQQQLLTDHLSRLREQVSGVSLDEEMVMLLQYQRSYQAAARLLTVIDEMLEQLITRTGLFGR